MRTRTLRLKVAVAAATVALTTSLGPATPAAYADPPVPPSPHDPALPGMRPTRLQIAGDLDRDGRADVVATKTTLDGALVQGRKGQNGALLWERVLPGTTEMGVVPIAALTGAFYRFGSTTTSVLPAQVDGGDGVVVAQYVLTRASYVSVGAAAARNLELRLTAIRGDGSLAWFHDSSTVPVAYASLGVGAGAGGFFIPSFHGLADLVGGPADDAMVVLEYSPTEYTADDVWHWEAIIVDGDTGRVTSQQRIVTRQGASLDMFAAGDVNGDGGPDYALLVGGVNRLRTHRADGKTIWVRDIDVSYEPTLVAAGDTDGDGRGDLLLDGQWVLSGADGRTLVERRYDRMSPRGDVDGDGRAEVGVVGKTSTGSVGHEAVDGTDDVTFVSEFPIASLPYSEFSLRVDIGDVDADGVPDASHDVRWSDGAEQGVVSGATGAKLWSGPVEGSDLSAERLLLPRAAIDGAGADLLRVRQAADGGLWVDAVDGAAGIDLWSTDLHTAATRLDSSVASAGDVDGDGRADVVINVNRRNCRYVWVGSGWRTGDGEACDYDMFVLSGADGSVLWIP